MEVTYAENDTVAVGTYLAVDPEGEAVTYSVSDEETFAITEDGGVLTFNSPPDFEKMEEHKVDVRGNDEKLLTVTITITNMEEGATVSIFEPQPQVGRMVTASVEDMDGGETDKKWQWSKSSDMAAWEDITGATSPSYVPKTADVDSYLRATVSYIDVAKPEDDSSTADVDESLTRDEASGISEAMVEASPDANASPMFPNTDTDDPDVNPDVIMIMVDENAEGEIDDAVVASDGDNDELLYSIGVVETDDAVGDNEDFTINPRSGQISVGGDTPLDFETPAGTGSQGTGSADNTYFVTVIATDPSGARDAVTVIIAVANVDEAPTGLGSDDDSTKLTLTEDSSTDDTDTPTLAAPATENLDYTATDPEDVTLVWSVTGADGALFNISPGGVLSFNPPATAAAPDHETKGEYKITIEVKGGDNSTAVSKLDVTVEITNVDEGGTVSLTARQPQVGKPVMASVKDPDGGETGVTWQWSRQVSGTPEDPNVACQDASESGWTDIPGAESASYMPVDGDSTYCLQATATYMDDAEAAVAGRIPARGATERAVEVKPAANDAPKFTDDEKPDGADPVEIEVLENSKGMIGDPFVASEPNSDALMYTLGGDDGGSFSIARDGGGQIGVGDDTKLDYETKPEYSLTVTATDPSGASDTVDVTVMLMDDDEPPVAPEGVTNADKVTYAENDTVAVGTYVAVDPEGEDVTWDVSDKGNFAISEEGVLTFKKSPDFEDPPPSTVDVLANKVKLLTVTITITNVEEGATVTMDQPQPQVGQPVMASVDDKDGGETDQMWQWSKSSDMAEWEDITGATQQSYTPQPADVDSYLRATVSYIDAAKPADDTSTADVDESETRDEASGISEEMVEGSPDANASPMFADGDDEDALPDVVMIMVDENSKGEIGAPLVATDADTDVLLYSLGVADTDNDNGEFTINPRSGQISVGGDTPLDFETPAGTGTPNTTYVVTVIATDPSSATSMVTVNIVVADVDEPPTGLDDDATELTLTEDDSTSETDTPPALGPSESLTYSAADADDADNGIDWDVSGADADSFDISDNGLLSFAETADAPDYESQSEYKITIEATGDRGDPGDSTATATLDVTITVINVDEDGTVSMTARQPQVGKPVMASVKDPDGGETGVTWQWSRQVSGTPEDPNVACQDASESGWTDIPGAESASYTPVGGDSTYCLQATAMYMDDAEAVVADRAPARGATERAVEVKPVANDAPKFTDDEKPDGADPVEIEVLENSKDMIGDPFVATDGNNDLMMYSLEGDDADSFDIVERDPGQGQLSVAEGTELDYESDKKTYSFMVKATDPSGASDTVDVTITLTDDDEPPVLFTEPPAPAENVAPMFDADTATFMVYENMDAGAAVGQVEATDEGDVLTYSDDSGYFDVDGSGNITTTMALDHEAMASHTVTVTATDDEEASDSIAVTVNVGDMHPGCTVMDNMGLTNDCEALLDAKGDLGGDLNWDADTAMDDWEGVRMSDDGRVSGIWLREKGLDGSVSAALGRLEMLTVLNLHTNMLTGEITDLSGASMLEELYLANNMLTGSIPTWLNGSTNLTNLWLWGNQLTGGIPDLSGLTNLDMLKLANNDLSGEINAMYLPQNVSWLIIDRNGFSGSIPDLSGLTSLRLLWLHTNEFTGSVPNGTMLPANLDDLNLRDNMLTGMIPDLSALDSLTRLRLHNNSLSGAVPGSLGGLDSLKQLWLHNETDDDGMLIGNNMFTSIDDGVGGLSNTLIEIQLGGNPWADDACVPADLADVATNDYEAAGIAVCGTDDGS